VDAIKKDFSIDDIKMALEQEAVNDPIEQLGDDEDLPENIMGAISRHRPVAPANGGSHQTLQIKATGVGGHCLICMDIPEDPVMTYCRHFFCRGGSSCVSRSSVGGRLITTRLPHNRYSTSSHE
jgi:hypothetical protein